MCDIDANGMARTKFATFTDWSGKVLFGRGLRCSHLRRWSINRHHSKKATIERDAKSEQALDLIVLVCVQASSFSC
jgi:hypothetical protein